MRRLITLFLALLSMAAEVQARCVVEGVSLNQANALIQALRDHAGAAGSASAIDMSELSSFVTPPLREEQLQGLFEPGGILSYSHIVGFRRSNRQAFRDARSTGNDSSHVLPVFERSFPIMQALEASGCQGSGRPATVPRAVGEAASTGADRTPPRAEGAVSACGSAPSDVSRRDSLVSFLTNYVSERRTAGETTRSRVTGDRAVQLQTDIRSARSSSGDEGWTGAREVYRGARIALDSAYNNVCAVAYRIPSRDYEPCLNATGHPRRIPNDVVTMYRLDVVEAREQWYNQLNISDTLYNLAAELRAARVAENLRSARTNAEVLEVLRTYAEDSRNHPGAVHELVQALLESTRAAVASCESARAADGSGAEGAICGGSGAEGGMCGGDASEH